MKHVIRKIRKLDCGDWVFIITMCVVPMVCVIAIVYTLGNISEAADKYERLLDNDIKAMEQRNG